LAGQLFEANELEYDLNAWHIGAVANGPGAAALIRVLAARLDRRLLLVDAGGGTTWAWLGGRRKITSVEVERQAPLPWPAEVSLAVAEPEQGIAGWRLTHRQAQAASPVSLRPLPRLVRYADVALLATALHDEVLAGALRRLYLEPLALGRDGGEALRQTLRAYLAAGWNVSCAAAAIGVSRQTVNSRLRIIEERIGRSLNTCTAELDTALRLDDLR
jgi:DNA-binding PucR family transcriptional regulator